MSGVAGLELGRAMRARPMDVSPQVWDRWFEILRSMTVDERVDIARQLTLSYQRELFTIVRAKHPDLPEEEIRLKVAARRLGRDVVRKVYGRDIDPD